MFCSKSANKGFSIFFKLDEVKSYRKFCLNLTVNFWKMVLFYLMHYIFISTFMFSKCVNYPMQNLGCLAYITSF